METAAAGGDDDAVDLRHLARGEVEAGEDGVGGLEVQAAANGVFDGFRLLVNLLEHVVVEGTLAVRGDFPGNLRRLTLDRDVREGAEFDLGRCEDGHFAVVQVDDVAGVGHKRGDVAGDHVGVLAEADHDGAAEAGGDDGVRVLGGNDRDAVGAGNLAESGGDGFCQVAVVELLDQVRDDFAVRVGREFVSGGFQAFPQIGVVFDDAVVDDGEETFLVGMRMGIAFAGDAVRGPAGMRDAGVHVLLAGGTLRLQVDDFADGFDGQDGFPVQETDARGIVAAVFQAFESVDEKGESGLRPGVSYNSAHNLISPWFMQICGGKCGSAQGNAMLPGACGKREAGTACRIRESPLPAERGCGRGAPGSRIRRKTVSREPFSGTRRTCHTTSGRGLRPWPRRGCGPCSRCRSSG